MIWEWFDNVARQLIAINKKLNLILKEVRHLSVDQATFDQHLQDLSAAIDSLVSAVQSKLSAVADFTDEDAALQAATQKVKDAMDTINPNVPDPVPAPDEPPAGDAPPPDEVPAPAPEEPQA